MLGEGLFEIHAEIDGVVTHSYRTRSIEDEGLYWDRISLGANRNLGAPEDMKIWWRDVRIWAR